MDCHDHWHAALDEYMDPNGFRMVLNSLVQALRNVTWLLQKQKAELDGFSQWYPAWQDTAGADPVMRWVIKARNRIVKEADLELLSTARLTLAFDWVNEEERVWNLPPRYRPVDIAAMLLKSGVPPYPAGESTLTIERRWVDKMLPEWELLDACDHAYGQLVEVVRAAHEASGVVECDLEPRKRECVDASIAYPLECSWTDVDSRTADFDLGSLSPYVSELRSVLPDPKESAKAAEHYKITDVPVGDVIQRVPLVFDHAKRLLETDGYAVTVAQLFRGQELIDIQVPVFADQAGKMLAMRSLANRVRMLGADGFLLVGEMWTAIGPSPEDLLTGNYVAARNRPDRTEALQVTGIAQSGKNVVALAPFVRVEGKIEVAEPQISEWTQPALMSYRPIFKAWGIANEDPMASLAEALESDNR